MNDDDIDDVLKEKWIYILNPYNNEFISQQINRFMDSFDTEQSVAHILRYQGKFGLVTGRYEQALANLTKLLEF